MKATMNRTEFLATLPPGVTPHDIRVRRARRELALAGGADQRGNGRRPADEFQWADAIAVRIGERLRANIDLRDAARLTAGLFPQWAPVIAADEAVKLDESEGAYLILIEVAGDDEYTIRAGELAAQLQNLPAGTVSFRAISLTRILAELRRDAAAAGVETPERFLPRFGSDEFMAWVETIGGNAAQRVREARKATAKQAALLAEAKAELDAMKTELEAVQRAFREDRDKLATMRQAGRPDAGGGESP